jgi:pyridinium-3,5-bisthiocarboxylic acid mononucleotide nickel chelatase
VPGRPNVLRAVLVDPAAVPDAAEAGDLATTAAVQPASGHGPGDHVVLEATIDDMTPELLAHAADALREAGALDVWMSQALMKKGRPGVVLHVLTAAADRERVAGMVFAETTTFGLRVLPCDRLYAQERRESVKIGRLKVGVRLSFVGGRLASVSPEYEDVRRVAAAVGRPARVVYEAAQSAARSRFSGS